MADSDRIRPYRANPRYWQYKGKPVLLLGGSVEDNLFQIPDLAEHLDLLKSVGGNYVRCTMSSRDEGNVWPYEKDEQSGLYDLTKPSGEYWRRFETLLRLTSERDIIAQVEVWATFDYYRENWQANPFNPANNVNYTFEESLLVQRVGSSPPTSDNPFFFTVPELGGSQLVLKYQQDFIDKLLSVSLQFGNVLYCMDNETHIWPQWAAYWSDYIKAAAAKAGAKVCTTEMFWQTNLAHPHHRAVIDHPETYDFFEASQNSGRFGQENYDRALWAREQLDPPRPINNVKIYGVDDTHHKWARCSRDGIERFWRNIFAGHAACRFHRPIAGLGLSELAQANIRSARMLSDSLALWDCKPAPGLLSDRVENQAYCLAGKGPQYAVFFTDGGRVELDVSVAGNGELSVRWLDIQQSKWSNPGIVAAGKGRAALVAPADGLWAAIVQASNKDLRG